MIRGVCGACSTPWKVPVGIAGKRASCSTCGNVFAVPMALTARPIDPPDDFSFLDVDASPNSTMKTGRQTSSWVELTIGLVAFSGLMLLLLVAWISRQESNPGVAPAGGDLSLRWLIATPFALVFLLVSIGLGLLLYALPSIIAHQRKHPNFPAIFALNILLGWAFVGWVGALVWALTEVRSRDHHHYHSHR